MNYPEAVRELEARGIMPQGMPELGPVRRALEKSGLLRRIDPRRNLIVAGTNGKGSTAATLSRLFVAAGERVGLYTSPHLVTTRERIRVNDEDLSENEFTAAYLSVKEIIRGERLTHFEALTLIAAHVFLSGERHAPVDWVVWEVGLGGLFDATNAIPHHYCAITKLGLDHQAILGSGLLEIARQKFGVIGQGAVVVHAPMQPELSALRADFAERTECRWIEAEPARSLGLDRISTRWGEARTSLWGERAAENTATALTLFEAIGFDPSRVLHALEEVRWPGRFSRFGTGCFPCPAYVSGDHNLQGVESLLRILGRFRWDTLHLVVGIGNDKDAEAMLEKLCALPSVKLYLTETAFKPLRLGEYPARFRKLAVALEEDPCRLLSSLDEKAGPNDLIVVTGSLYLVGRILLGDGFAVSAERCSSAAPMAGAAGDSCES